MFQHFFPTLVCMIGQSTAFIRMGTTVGPHHVREEGHVMPGEVFWHSFEFGIDHG